MVLFVCKCIFIVMLIVQLRKLIGIADVDTYLCSSRYRHNRNIRKNDAMYVCKVYLIKLLLYFTVIEVFTILLFDISNVNAVSIFCIVFNTTVLVRNNERFWWIKKSYSRQLVHLVTESTAFISLLVFEYTGIFLIYNFIIEVEKNRIIVFLSMVIIVSVIEIRVLNKRHVIIMKILKLDDHIKVRLKNGEEINTDLIGTFLSCTDEYLIIREYGNHNKYYKKDDILKIIIGKSRDYKSDLFEGIN